MFMMSAPLCPAPPGFVERGADLVLLQRLLAIHFVLKILFTFFPMFAQYFDLAGAFGHLLTRGLQAMLALFHREPLGEDVITGVGFLALQETQVFDAAGDGAAFRGTGQPTGPGIPPTLSAPPGPA